MANRSPTLANRPPQAPDSPVSTNAANKKGPPTEAVIMDQFSPKLEQAKASKLTGVSTPPKSVASKLGGADQAIFSGLQSQDEGSSGEALKRFKTTPYTTGQIPEPILNQMVEVLTSKTVRPEVFKELSATLSKHVESKALSAENAQKLKNLERGDDKIRSQTALSIRMLDRRHN